MVKQVDKTWESYEEVAAFVLDQCAAQFGLAGFDGKQVIPGTSGADWEVDARGWTKDGATFVVVECKKHTGTGISQALTGSLAYTIKDTGAVGGFLVSPCGLQSGAKKVAAAEGIQEIKLDPKSTTAAYFGEWLGKLQAGFIEVVDVSISDHLLIQVIDKHGNVTQIYDSDSPSSGRHVHPSKTS